MIYINNYKIHMTGDILKMNKLKKYMDNPLLIFNFLSNRNMLNWMDDELYLKIRYYICMGKKLNLKNPETFNEKLQWLKLYDRNPEYAKMVDKYEVKEYISQKIGKEYIIPTLGIYNNFEEIDFDKLPNQFVMKCTNDSGGNIICKNKQELNYHDARKKIEKCLKQNYYNFNREWPYKDRKPRILIEKYMEDSTGNLLDYKIYAINGICKYVMVCLDREKKEEKTKFIYFDKNWNMKKDFSKDGKEYGDKVKVQKPKNLEKMFEFAEILSKGIPFVRVDFYEVDGKIYFGELTFFPSGGFDNTRTKECEEYLDQALKIGDKK